MDEGDAIMLFGETREELGIDLPTEGEVIGPLDELRPRTPVLPPVIVRPYVARLDGAPSKSSRRAIER